MTDKLVDIEKPFVLCRMPEQQQAIKVVGKQLQAFGSLSAIPRESDGYIMAPFIVDEDNPVYLLRDIECLPFDIDNVVAKDTTSINPFDSNREDYAKAFGKVAESIRTEECNKVVLSRSISSNGNDINVVSMFAKACKAYPHCYVALINIPQRGSWLTATPELLYMQQGNKALTMALAGTMAWEDFQHGQKWNTKNIREQQLVLLYIAESLGKLRIPFIIEPQKTARAGHLAHLCNEVAIEIRNGVNALDLLSVLHPTPAVAGIPLQSALETIEHSEGKGARGYYAGFNGFLNHTDLGTQCFVTLRLMHIDNNGKITLHAGGGILPESEEEAEWNETQLKLQTMLRLLS